MMEKMDLRVRKTYMALTNTFLDLLEEKHFEDITVNELCDRAMIRRATFYKHFGDKYEFFTFMIREIIDKFNTENTRQIHTGMSKEHYIEVIQYTLDFVDENGRFVHSLLKSSMLSELLNIISEQIVLDVHEQFKKDKQSGITLPVEPDLMAQIFTGALLYTIKWWISKKYDISKEELVEQFSKWILHE